MARADRGRPHLVSVVIPVRDEEEHVGAQLEALAKQTYEGSWEVVVVDNGSSDWTMRVVERFTAKLPALTVVDASARRGLAYAKNMGIAWARGDLLAFCDADDVVSPGWLASLVEGAADADVVGGPFEYEALNDALRRAWRPEREQDALEVGFRFLPYAPGGNCAIWSSVALELGWNESFTFGGDDQDFSWRVQLAGYRIGFAPGALVHLRFRQGLAGLARQWFSYGKAGPLLYRTFRGAGMPRSDFGETYRVWRWLAKRSPGLVRSAARRGNWIRVASLRAGRIAGSVRCRTLFL
jgi:glycosyltransferase involved in cell wall biosynthesis